MNEVQASSSSVSSSKLADACVCPCCADPSTPYHPLDFTDSGCHYTTTHRSKDRGMKTYSRHIQPSWYKKFPWISVCSSSLKIYCTSCRDAKFRGLLNFPKHYKATFVDDGFSNLKKALERFREHERSVMHSEAVMKLASLNSATGGIDVRVNAQVEHDQKQHQTMLIKLLKTLKYLTRQGLPLRGHNEDSESFEGNLYQLLLL